MNERRITELVDDLFNGIIQTDEVREQKEELRIHLSEGVRDCMAEGYGFDEALEKVKNSLGDFEELLAELRQSSRVRMGAASRKAKKRRKKKVHERTFHGWMKLVALSPFIYVALGFLIGGWFWAWGWVIIPMSGITVNALGNKNWTSLIGLTPFIYVLLGILIGGWFWAWGWVIIPIAGIIFTGKPRIEFGGSSYDDDETEEHTDSFREHGYEAGAADDRRN